MIADAHCHLSLLPDPDRALDEAESAGVSPVLAVSMDADEAEAVLALRERHRGRILAGVGLHPSRVVALSEEAQREHLRRLETLAGAADFIGEIGLDYKDARAESERGRQREALEAQLSLAARLGLSVNLHTRRADREVMQAAIEFHVRSGLGALLHWFTHSTRLARRCAEAGIFISAGPSILTGPAATVASKIDTSILLVETDSPVEYAGLGTARPAWAARVNEALAALHGVAPLALARILSGNLSRFLGPARAGHGDREFKPAGGEDLS